MFALPFNFPFRKNDGSLSTIGAEISGGGGGGYTLPTATASRLGGVKVGSNLSVTDDGTLSAPAPTPAYELPTASADTLGGVKIGSGISIDENGVISASGGGGGTKYLHNIIFNANRGSNTNVANISIIVINESNTPLANAGSVTISNFKTFLVNSGYTLGDRITASGSAVLSGSTPTPVVWISVDTNSFLTINDGSNSQIYVSDLISVRDGVMSI